MSLVEVVASIWTYVVIALVEFITFLILLILVIVTYPFDKRRTIPGRLFRMSSILTMKANPLWDFSIYGKLPEKTPEKTVFVSNHLSLTDTALISHLPWEMKWLSKASMFWVPCIGWNMALAGDIFLHRGHRDSAKIAMDKCRKWLDKGANVMIFPEGTRSRSGEMGEFKDGAFRLAIEAQADLLPLCVSGTDESIRVNSWRMHKAKGLVKVGKPISTKGMTIDDILKLKEQARKQIVDMYEEMKPLCYPEQNKKEN